MNIQSLISMGYLAIAIIASYFMIAWKISFFNLVSFYGITFLILSALNFTQYLLGIPKDERKQITFTHHIISHYWESAWGRIYIFELGLLSVPVFILLVSYQFI